jgi:hypothetical protein
LTEPVAQYATSKMVLLASWLAVIVPAVLVVGLTATPIALLSPQVWEVVYIAVLGTVVVVMSAYMVLAVTLRCPACRRRFLIESRGPNIQPHIRG